MSRTYVCELHAVVSGHEDTVNRWALQARRGRQVSEDEDDFENKNTSQNLKRVAGNSSFTFPDVSNREEFNDRGDIWFTILEEKKLSTWGGCQFQPSSAAWRSAITRSRVVHWQCSSSNTTRARTSFTSAVVNKYSSVETIATHKPQLLRCTTELEGFKPDVKQTSGQTLRNIFLIKSFVITRGTHKPCGTNLRILVNF